MQKNTKEKSTLVGKKVAVYCGASDQIDKSYLDEGYEIGKAIANYKASLVWGAGSTGVMGTVAKGCDDYGGTTIGVAPYFMKDYEPLFDCTTLIQTNDMSERKNIMEEQADAFVIAPGGSGTLDEFFQVVCLKQLDRHNKPIVVLNVDGFYNSLISCINELCAKKFIRQNLEDLIFVAETVDSAMEYLCNAFND